MAKLPKSRTGPVKVRKVKSTRTSKKVTRKKVASRRIRRGRSMY